MAEIEPGGALGKQCLSRRLPEKELIAQEVVAWEDQRDGSDASVDWRFQAEDARLKLKRLHPKV
jgi:hypothetical protein